jgi:Glycoside hydrolase family 44
LKRPIGAGLLLLILTSAAFLGLSGRWRDMEAKLHQEIHALRHPANATNISQPLADPLLVGSAGSSKPAKTQSAPIYQAGALSAGWQDWSWATHALNARHDDPGAGAIAVTYGAWTGLYFHANQAIDAWTGTVSLTLDGGTIGGQELAVTLLDGSGNWGKRVSLSQYLPQGGLPAGQWISVTIPLSDSLALGTPVGGVSLQEVAGKAQPTMYVSRVALDVADMTSVPVGHTAIALQVNAQAGQHAISPYIYGLADDGGTNYDQQVRPTLIRWGGNPNSRYNWKLGNAWNTASDYLFENTNYGSPGGSASDSAIAHSNTIGAAEWLTIPTLGWVAKDTSSFSFPGPDGKPSNGQGSSCTNRTVTADPTQTSIKVGTSFMQDWVRHLQNSHLPVQFYSMDNEPELWGVTHYDVHPTCTSYDEIYKEFTTYATAIKAVAPNSMVTGPATCCWYYYWNSMVGSSDKTGHGNMDFLPWFLAAVRRHDQQSHQRTLDVLDVHYYPDGLYNNTTDAVTSAWRLLETRSLWDPTYIDHSWIGQPVQLIPRLQALISQQYPGTRLSIGEWNFGADTSMNGGLAIADVLGIFGQQGLYMAAYWRNPPGGSPGAMAYQMYRNYDGHDGAFGETSVLTSSSDRDRVAIYGSLRQRDGHLITILINKMPTTEADSTVQITGFQSGQTSIYCYDATHPTAIQQKGQIVLGSRTAVTLPPYSITVLDSSPAASR